MDGDNYTVIRQNTALRAIAFVAVIAVSAEVPKGCANSDKDLGEHENVKPIASATATVQPGHSARPGNPAKHDRKRKVKLEAIWDPKREVTITWKISGHAKSFGWYQSPWSRTQDTYSGDRVELTIENHGQGGFTSCSINVDGVGLRKLVENPENQPYIHRNDAGDCKVWVIVP